MSLLVRTGKKSSKNPIMLEASRACCRALCGKTVFKETFPSFIATYNHTEDTCRITDDCEEKIKLCCRNRDFWFHPPPPERNWSYLYNISNHFTPNPHRMTSFTTCSLKYPVILKNLRNQRETVQWESAATSVGHKVVLQVILTTFINC